VLFYDATTYHAGLKNQFSSDTLVGTKAVALVDSTFAILELKAVVGLAIRSRFLEDFVEGWRGYLMRRCSFSPKPRATGG
jgi:hypothetical protein